MEKKRKYKKNELRNWRNKGNRKKKVWKDKLEISIK